jgi:hypothetical protein
MGADLILTNVAVRADFSASDETIKAAVEAALPEGMPFKDLPDTFAFEDAIADWENENHSDDEPGGLEIDAVTPPDLLAKVREVAAEVVLGLTSTLVEGGRSAAEYAVGDYRVHLIGGTSWGDSPSTDFDLVSDFWEVDDALHRTFSKRLGIHTIDELAGLIKRGTDGIIYTPAEPRSKEDVVRDASETNDLEGFVALDQGEVLEGSVFSLDAMEAMNDAFSMAMTGSTSGLMDITFVPVGVTEGDLIVYSVSGEVRMEEFEWSAT